MATPTTDVGLPSLNDFLIERLEPVDNPPPDLECPICSEPPTEPVHPPCHASHIFCLDCVSMWLKSGNNTCPHCRAVLYDLNADDSDDSDSIETPPADVYLPTLDELLTDGLEDVSDPAPDLYCPICSEVLTDPVHPPCHSSHIFCYDCLVTWFDAGKTTCPQCRALLYVGESDDSDLEDPELDEELAGVGDEVDDIDDDSDLGEVDPLNGLIELYDEESDEDVEDVSGLDEESAGDVKEDGDSDDELEAALLAELQGQGVDGDTGNGLPDFYVEGSDIESSDDTGRDDALSDDGGEVDGGEALQHVVDDEMEFTLSDSGSNEEDCPGI